jgi:hypothetical protein
LRVLNVSRFMPKNAIPDSVKRAVAISTSSAMFLHVSSFMSDYGNSRYTILLHVPFQTYDDIPHPINGTCNANRTVNPAYGTSSETRTPGARRRSSYSICTNPAPRVSPVKLRLLNPACIISLGLLGKLDLMSLPLSQFATNSFGANDLDQ